MKRIIPLLLILIISGTVFLGRQVAAGDTSAAVTTAIGSPAAVDLSIWRELAASPSDRATFVVVMKQDGDSESTVPAQLSLLEVLDWLMSVGSVTDYRPYLGLNTIVVEGDGRAIQFLRDWPDVTRLEAYRPNQHPGFDVLSENHPLQSDATGVVTGLITKAADSTPMQGVQITLYRQVTADLWEVAGEATSVANGTYQIGGLVTAFYRARFVDPIGDHITEYYRDRENFNQADSFVVTDGQTTSNINAVMDRAGKVTGKATKPGGGNLADISVSALRQDGELWRVIGTVVTNNQGAYAIGALKQGTYRIRFSDPFVRYVTEYYDNMGDLASAHDVIVTGGATTANVNAEMGPYGTISGQLTGPDGTTAVASMDVFAYEYNASGGYWDVASYGESDVIGNYHVSGLLTHNYRVEFSDSLGFFATEYYDDAPDVMSAADVAVTLGLDTPDINASLSAPVVTQTLPLMADWNLTSFALELEQTETGAALSPIAGSYDVVWAYEGCVPQWQVYDPIAPPFANTLKNVDVEHGMWLQTTTPVTLTITGTQAFRTTFDLCAGWNLISWPSLTSKPVAEGLSGISGKYDLVWGYKAADLADPWKKYNPSLPFGNDLVNLESGYGYWVRMTQPATLTIANR